MDLTNSMGHVNPSGIERVITSTILPRIGQVLRHSYISAGVQITQSEPQHREQAFHSLQFNKFYWQQATTETDGRLQMSFA